MSHGPHLPDYLEEEARVAQLARPPAPFRTWEDVPESFRPSGVTTKRLQTLLETSEDRNVPGPASEKGREAMERTIRLAINSDPAQDDAGVDESKKGLGVALAIGAVVLVVVVGVTVFLKRSGGG